MLKRVFKCFLSFSLILSTCLAFSACGTENKTDSIKISVWVSGETMELTQTILDEYLEEHPDKNYEFVVSEQSESSCATVIKADVDNAADIFVFADDQLDELVNIGILKPITTDKEEIISAFGGEDSIAAQACMRDGNLYAYPRNAGNGYFLYYNKAYLTEDDVKTLSGILKKCDSFDKKFAIEMTSGWYMYSFFKAAGLDITLDEDDNIVCNWNSTDGTYTGVDVFNAICEYTADEGFLSATDNSTTEGIADGTIIAAVNGPWNANSIKEVWGEDYAATKLPTYSVNGDDLQMCSFSGYKLVGVNANCEYYSDAAEIAEYLTNEENQLRVFEKTGELPANEKAANNAKVAVSPVASALLKQSEYSSLQRVPTSFWSAARILGTFLGSANKDEFDPQELLDNFMSTLLEG